MKAFNIQWDTDGDMKLFNNLPKEKSYFFKFAFYRISLS